MLFAEIVQSNGYSVGWFTLALLNAALAQNRGRRGWVWFLVSSLIGPLATLLLLDPRGSDPAKPYRNAL